MDKKMINFRADEGVREKLQQLADHTQRTQSNWLRWIIDREWKELTSPTPPDNGDDGKNN
jgi:predicted DNA-binding protein